MSLPSRQLVEEVLLHQAKIESQVLEYLAKSGAVESAKTLAQHLNLPVFEVHNALQRQKSICVSYTAGVGWHLLPDDRPSEETWFPPIRADKGYCRRDVAERFRNYLQESGLRFDSIEVNRLHCVRTWRGPAREIHPGLHLKHVTTLGDSVFRRVKSITPRDGRLVVQIDGRVTRSFRPGDRVTLRQYHKNKDFR